MDALPVILGTVSLLLTVVLVAPLALCCCFKRRRREGERAPLLGDGNTTTGRSYSGAPTSSIQSPDLQWGQPEPVTSEDVTSIGTDSPTEDSHRSPKANTPPTQSLVSDERLKVTITEGGEQSASSVSKVTFVNEKSFETEEAEHAGVPQLNYRRVLSRKDHQPFESNSYNGIYTEVGEWVKPLVTNKELHSAYLSYVTPPRTIEKLKKLSQFLQEYGTSKALQADKTTPPVTYAPMEPVISALGSDWATQVNEVVSMIVVSEALVEFPQHIVKKAIELSPEKRTTLVDFICSTPYGVDKHVYTDEGPFGDPELNPFMTRMGFSLPPPSKNLVLELKDEKNEDRLTAGLILMVATRAH